MRNRKSPRWMLIGSLGVVYYLTMGVMTTADGQSEQRVEVIIRNSTFITTQAPLTLNTPAVIVIRNDDDERHDFGSSVFQGISTEVQSDGVTTYGQGIRGVFVGPHASALIRFTVKRPGQYEFKCSIHPSMTGELLLLNIQAV